MAYTCRPLLFALGTASLHKSFIRGLPNRPRFVNAGGSDGWGEGKNRNAYRILVGKSEGKTAWKMSA
jgi:hypothetical protein